MAVVENEVEDFVGPVEEVVESLSTEDKARWAKGKATTRQRREERQAAAPPPGHAKTIEEILARGAVTGAVATQSRRRVLKALVSIGGELRAEKKRNGRHGAINELASMIDGKATVLAGLLKSMVADNQIGVEKPHIRDMSRIFLLDPIAPKWSCDDCDGKSFSSKDALRKHRDTKHATSTDLVRAEQVALPAKSRSSLKGGAAALMPPMPSLGSNVTVFAQIVERDGTVKIGVRNDEGDYMTSIDGWRAAE